MSSGGRIRKIPTEILGPGNTSGVWNFNEISYLINSDHWNLRLLSQLFGSGGAKLNGQASLITFWGNGRDGNVEITNNNTIVNSYTHLTATANTNTKQIVVSDASSFRINDEILLYQTQSETVPQVGSYQFNSVESKDGNTIYLKDNLIYNFLGASFNSKSGATFQNLGSNGFFTLGGLSGFVSWGRPSDTQMTNGDIVSLDPFVGSSLYTSISYGDLGDDYGFIAIGYFRPPTTGTYTFYTSSDDGSAVWVGDIAAATTGRTLSNVVVNNNATGYQGNTKRSGTISLTADVYYPIRIIHREGAYGSNLTFSWAGPGISETTSLTQYFYYYQTNASVNSQIIRVPNYNNLTISNGSITCKSWDGFSGGVVCFRCAGNLTLNQSTLISTSGKGFRGGQQSASSGNYEYGYSGENYTRFNNARESTSASYLTAGGAGRGGDGSGGGGSHRTVGLDGNKQLSSSDYGRGATTLIGNANLNQIYFGGGGGGVGSHSNGRIGVSGGNGGGSVIILCKNSNINGVIESNGGAGTNGVYNFNSSSASGGGGGAGGSVNFITEEPFVLSSDTEWDKVVLSLDFDSSFSDLSSKKNIPSISGNPTISSAESKFGGFSGFFNGSSYISFPASNDFNFGTGDFTIECWVYLLSQGTSGYNHYFSVVNQNTFTFKSYNQGYYLYANNATQVQTAAAPVLNSWQHLALVRNGTSLRIYVNGTLAGSSTINASNSYGTNGSAFIGSPTNPNNEFLNGYLDEFRITKGLSRYNADFTPSTVAFSKEKLYANGGIGGSSGGGNGKIGGRGGDGRVKTFVLPTNFQTPIQPLELSVVENGDQFVSLTWKTLTPIFDLANHIVEFTAAEGSTQTVLTNTINNSFTLPGLTNEINYTVRVASIDSKGSQSAWSNSVVASPVLLPLAVGVNPNIWSDTSKITSANSTQLSTITNFGTSGNIT
jgi:hypothetical protein